MKVLCQKCKQKPAVFYYEQSVNGKKTECALCADCATEWKKAHLSEDESLFQVSDISPFAGIDALFGSLFAPTATSARKGKVCPLCGASFSDLKRSGKVGCAVCYDTFEEELRPTLRSIHGTQSHTGRVPASLEDENKRKKEIEKLRQRLNEAIMAQAFEEAATLRDQIKALEADA